MLVQQCNRSLWIMLHGRHAFHDVHSFACKHTPCRYGKFDITLSHPSKLRSQTNSEVCLLCAVE